MGHSEVRVFTDPSGPELYLSGELRRGGSWAALVEGPDRKFGVRRSFVGIKVASEANPKIEVCLVRSGKLPELCLLEVQAGGTAEFPYRHVLIHDSGAFYKLDHGRSDEAMLAVKRGALPVAVARELLGMPSILEGVLVPQPRNRLLRPETEPNGRHT